MPRSIAISDRAPKLSELAITLISIQPELPA